MTSAEIHELARQCGFELAGVARAEPLADSEWYHQWVAAGYAGDMRYLADRRAAVRDDPRRLLPAARSIICVGKLYNTPWPYSARFDDRERAWISRYAWGEDYHLVLRRGLARLEGLLRECCGNRFQSKICVDTAPLLERSYARQAGLGWIGKNTCLINQPRGSWFFLGELLVSIDIEPDAPPPERCGTCTRCIDACPTAALVPAGSGYAVDSRRCISLHDRTARAGSRRAPCRHRVPRIRMRYLSGRVPVEPAGTGDHRSRISAPPFRAAAGEAGGDQ